MTEPKSPKARTTAKRRSIDEIAAQFLMRLENGADVEERKRIFHWIDQLPEHAVAFARARSVWRASEALKLVQEPAVGSTRADTVSTRTDPTESD
ncbi:DUF4880 domain-containing protein [Novosphingobium sp. ZN18A2]|uniref:DUF4880 domain-containing protein n=1 Tax=Novosphingobium sp. ZN18A2 TaxID=3079861 RepID=UPI0030CE6DB7